MAFYLNYMKNIMKPKIIKEENSSQQKKQFTSSLAIAPTVSSDLNSTPTHISNLNPLREALEKCKAAFKVTFIFAFFINLLMLVTPLYSLQVLDRVIGGGNLDTLLMLSLIIAFIYFIYTLLQIARSFTLIKIGEWLDNKLSPVIFAYSISASATKVNTASSQMLRDFQTVKTFLTSTGINTLFDAPWSIIYIVIIFMIHPYIGIVTILGTIIILFFAFFNAVATNRTLGESAELSVKAMGQADIANRNAEAVEAMGMIENVKRNWAKFNENSLIKQSLAGYRNEVISNFSKFIRNLMQMAVTGTGAYVVVTSNGADMTTGGMIASSIIVGRALAPFENAIVMWKTISSAMKSYKNLNGFFDKFQARDQGEPISSVNGNLVIENLCYEISVPTLTKTRVTINPLMPSVAPKPQLILKNISFSIKAGEILAIIGPSGAGKSTLAKLIIGVWQASSGTIKLDDQDVYTWNRQNFGEHVGYLPQGIELFSGSVKQNIARMSEKENPEMVIKVAKMCGAHEMILRLPKGYDTDIGVGGENLSAGQRQRIGLARAFYGNPKLVVLDEPNANLDEAGELALSNTLKSAKKEAISVIVISHRPSILSRTDKIMIIQDGIIVSFGPKSETQGQVKMLENGMIHINN
jgi:ATP-binding cassette subfamily C protein